MASANRFAWSFYFRTSSHCQRWEKYYISLDWWIQRLGPLVSKQTQFSGFNSWARVFKGGSKREKQRKRKLSAITIRFTDRETRKAKQTTNWSVSTFKGKLKFYCYKIVKYKPRAEKNIESVEGNMDRHHALLGDSGVSSKVTQGSSKKI